MINTETLFILGAGASKPYGYPLGSELRSYIITHFQNEYRNQDPKKSMRNIHSYNLIDEFCRIFKQSSNPSIDLFLSRNSLFYDIGKVAICLSINHFEQSSKFREECLLKDQDWYSYLYNNKLASSLTKSENYIKYQENKIKFLTFNYDRSFEQFLFESYRCSFSEIEIKKPLPFEILHVFGMISPLNWQNEYSGIKYKSIDENIHLYNELQKNIKIIFDDSKKETIKFIKEYINWANKIFILGFGYAEENIKILDIPNSLKTEHMIYGTAIGKTEKEINDIRNLFGSDFKDNKTLKIENCTCIDLLRNYL